VYIHNYYADILLSVRVLFDNHIFQNRDYVKRYEFNMGNRSIQLPVDYKPNYEFPNIIVTLNDETPSYGQRPDVSQKTPGYNLDQIPVLYNQTKENVLLVQEEMVNVPISCTINCESQFQAKEISTLVRRWLPINKFIQFLSFQSFLEVSPEFLSINDFNPAVHSISNIYTKLNKRTGEIDYCYSLQYDPFIRLDSISTAIPDSTQRSFQVVVDITYMIQMPLYMFSDQLTTTVEKIDILVNPTTGFEPINDYPSSKIINYLNNDIITLKKGFVRRTYLLLDDDEVESNALLDSVILNPTQITNTSTGGQNISVTKGSNDYLYITLGNSETRYSSPINLISNPDDIRIAITDDNYLLLQKDFAGVITTSLYKITQGLTIKFDPSDFILTTDYSYNLVKGKNIIRDYQDYTLDLVNNSITINFNNSEFSLYQPSITSPLMVQFYLKETTFPSQVGGIQPEFGLVRVINIRQTAVEISWISKDPTTSQLEYGTTTDYGSLSVLKEELTYSHHITIYGLTADTIYHYRLIVTKEDDETIYTSDDYTFTTLE